MTNVLTGLERFLSIWNHSNAEGNLYSPDDLTEYVAQHTFLGFGVSNFMDPTFGAKGDGTTNDTAAVTSACANNGLIVIPNHAFVITSSIVLTGNRPVIIMGMGPQSRIINRCPAGSPAFQIVGAQYWEMRDFAILGDINYPNDAISTVKDSNGVRPCYWRMRNLFLCPNGNGIHMQDVNTATIEHCQYWPSGYNGGATATNALLKNAILADGTSTVNDVTIKKLNAVNYTTIANGGAAICWNGPVGCGGITIDECELEGTDATQYRSIFLTNVTAGATLRSNFVENSEVKIASCTNVRIEHPDGGSTAVYTITGSDQLKVDNSNGISFSANNTNNTVAVENSTFPGAAGYANTALYPYSKSVRTTGSVLVPDNGEQRAYCHVKQTATVTLPNVTTTTILFTGASTDPFSKFSNATGRFTPGVVGPYRVSFLFFSDGSTANQYFMMEINLNGVLQSRTMVPQTGGRTGGSVTAVVTLATITDYISVDIYNSDASSHLLSEGYLDIEPVG